MVIMAKVQKLSLTAALTWIKPPKQVFTYEVVDEVFSGS
jgi:hypothetical protein